MNLFNVNGTCSKCPKGTHGNNCSKECPANMYGELCLKKCDCQSHQECNKKHGCIDSGGICSNKESHDVICCDSFILTNGYCKACPSGTFWKNCSLECPKGRYGMFCKETCDCKTSECDKAIGCLQKECPKGTHGKNCSEECPVNMYGESCLEKCDCKSHQECNNKHGCIDIPLTMFNISIAAASLSITSVVIGVTVCVVLRYKSRRQSVYVASISFLNEESIGLSRVRENTYSSLAKDIPN